MKFDVCTMALAERMTLSLFTFAGKGDTSDILTGFQEYKRIIKQCDMCNG